MSKDKVKRARTLLKVVPILRREIDAYLDDLLMSATFYLTNYRKGKARR